eukprot:c24150_g9_i1 orf=3-1127(-)
MRSPLQVLPCFNGVLLLQPSIEAFASLLYECSKNRDRFCGLRLLAHIRRSGLETHTFLGNNLVCMLAELGSMHDAQQVFDILLYKNECSWDSLITGYVKCGKLQEGIVLYGKMQEDEDDTLRPRDHSFVALLKACSKLKDMESGYEIHGEVSRLGLPERNLVIGCALVDMYAKHGLLAKAQQIFDKLPTRNVVTWTALITGFAEHGRGKEALDFFEQMHLEGVSPNTVTFVCSLRACRDIGDAMKGQELHAEIERHGLLCDLVVGNAVVDMYAKCGLLDAAHYLFDKLPNRDIISWTALIAGYVDHGHGEEALDCFEQMQQEGLFPDAVTMLSILPACGSIGAANKGNKVHADIIKEGFLGKDCVLGTALVDMYA